MFEPVIKSVIGRVPECCPAAIEGYRRLEVTGELFPGIIKESGGDKIEGVLYSDIRETEWKRLTAFEDDFYELEQVSVLCLGAERLALAYVVPPSRRFVLSKKVWNVEFYREHYFQRFLPAKAPDVASE
jgi:Gamma-glutamyl cyclotransferase, AIG2-like